MSRLYKQVLEAAVNLLADLLVPDGWVVVLRAKPKFIHTHATLPCVIVAPVEDLAEEIIEETFSNGAFLGFPVFVGNFVDDRQQDSEWLFKRTDVRETIRLALWKPIVLGLQAAGEYDVAYDPKGSGGEKPPANVLGSWQKFTHKITTTRQGS